MTGHGKIPKEIDENEYYIPDDETINDYLVQKSNEFEHEVIIIGEIITRLKHYNAIMKGLREQNQSFASDDCDLPVTEITTMTEEEEK